jgi:hypothetical protein
MQLVSSTPTIVLRSDSCDVADLYTPYALGAEARSMLLLASGWARRWTASWRFAGAETEVVCPVRDLASVSLEGAEPVRRFT